jgi:hypothetical protein
MLKLLDEKDGRDKPRGEDVVTENRADRIGNDL